MLNVSSHFEYELRKLIDAEIDRKKEILAEGQVPVDFAQYKQIVGEIAAYRRVVGDYFEEANKKLNER